jgi:hypothetical protein
LYARPKPQAYDVYPCSCSAVAVQQKALTA